MDKKYFVSKTQQYLDKFCYQISTRRLGTQGNRDATQFFKEQIDHFNFEIETQSFHCIESCLGEADLSVNNEAFEIFPSPFTISCDCTAEIVCAGSIAELEKLDAKGRILLVYGEIAKEQLMPKGFKFYNPEEHQHIYRLLEEKKPAAILTATSKNPDLAGAVYPFPMIEDGDFDIPTAYLTDVEGKKLLKNCGKQASLRIDAQRNPSTGENIIARKGDHNKKIVLCAHIDTKPNTPGALDNASGVIILLLLAELLSNYQGDLGIEIVAFNGEEYYSTPGEIEYLNSYNGDFSSILLAINLDDIGYIKGRTSYSFYGVPDALANLIREVYQKEPDFFEGPPWYQSDHGIFMAKGIPAIAITEENVLELMAEITHTEKDIPAIIDNNKLVENAFALKEVLLSLDNADI